jgi:DNA-binding NarL/FixJ family response regulator
MTVHVLIVEDDDDFVAEISASITDVASAAQITVARGRERACDLLDTEFFDFAILDLNIPTQENGLDAAPEHGKFVFHHARLVAPGTKLFVLTGSPSDDFVADMLRQKHDADIWSEGAPIATVEFLRKLDLVQAPAIIHKMLGAIAALSNIELALVGVNLQTEQDRLVRILAKRFDAVRCEVSSIGSGKSGAVPLRLQLFDANGMPIQQVVAKLAPHAKVQDENARYDNHIVLLDAAATPRKLLMQEFGARSTAGLFYQLADGYGASMFAVMAENDEQAALAVTAASQLTARWSQGNAQVRQPIATIRRCWVSDAKAAELAELYGLGWLAAFEGTDIQTRWHCVHGDLHGENILVSADASAVLIDFGDVGHSAASYDPVTLELSAVLQNNPTQSADWPTVEQCKVWHDLDRYLEASPIPAFVRACRGWAGTSAAGQREVAAAAYCYLLRQLKYPDTDKPRTLALMEGARALFEAT